MITVFGLMRFNDTYSADDARKSLADRAADEAARAQLPGSIVNLVGDRSQLGITYNRGSLELDAISQFHMSDVSAGFNAADLGKMDVGGGLSQEGLKDIFVLTAFKNTVIEPPTTGKFVKRMSLLTRRPDVEPERFKDEWFGLHAVMLKRMPGILGYKQNLIIDAPPQDDRTPITGIVELWFESPETIDAAFRSDRGLTTMTHAKEFIGEITTFLVEPVAL